MSPAHCMILDRRPAFHEQMSHVCVCQIVPYSNHWFRSIPASAAAPRLQLEIDKTRPKFQPCWLRQALLGNSLKPDANSHVVKGHMVTQSRGNSLHLFYEFNYFSFSCIVPIHFCIFVIRQAARCNNNTTIYQAMLFCKYMIKTLWHWSAVKNRLTDNLWFFLIIQHVKNKTRSKN